MNIEGTWRFDEDGEIRAYDADGGLLANIAFLISDSESLGPLIASAPELYEALEAMVAFGELVERKNLVGDEGCFWPVEIARAALAKARGGDQ